MDRPHGEASDRPASGLRVCRSGPVLLMEFDRLEARNAIDLPTAEAISAALDELDGDPALRVGIVTGRGGCFSTGMDLKAFALGQRPTVPGRGFAGIVAQPPVKPLIAAVEGYALAGGFEIALSADLIVASETAVFGLPEVRRGLIASGGALMRLPRRIPYHVAMDLILTGEFRDAEWAHRNGLVSRLVGAGEALAEAERLADVLGANGPLALLASKQIVEESALWPSDEMFERQRRFSEPVSRSRDALEGATAFVEKRPPRWTGR